MRQKLIKEFYAEMREADRNLETTTEVCKVVIELTKRKLKCEDWKEQALWAAKKEWGPDTTIVYGEGFCVVKNIKTGNKKTINCDER